MVGYYQSPDELDHGKKNMLEKRHARETLYDMDMVRMYYRIILLCNFTIIPKSCTVNYLSAASHVFIIFVYRRC